MPGRADGFSNRRRTRTGHLRQHQLESEGDGGGGYGLSCGSQLATPPRRLLHRARHHFRRQGLRDWQDAGGEAVSNFANFATSEEALNLSFIHAALLLVIFSGTPEYIIVASTHIKDKFDIALSNAFGGIVQVFFVVFGFTLLVIGFVGGSIPIQLATVILLFFAFPSMFILRVMITDDSKVNALESIAMLAVFVMMLYILIFFGVPSG